MSNVIDPEPEAPCLDQMRLAYDYVKFHIGLYLATPTVLSVLATGLEVNKSRYFSVSLIVSCCIYLVAGAFAAWQLSAFVYTPWGPASLRRLQDGFNSPLSRLLHHGLYWAGLLTGVVGIILALALMPAAPPSE